jgi:hypothetical protein
MSHETRALAASPPFRKRLRLILTAVMIAVFHIDIGIGVSAILNIRSGEPDLYHNQHLRLLIGSVGGILVSAAMLMQWWAQPRWLKALGYVCLLLSFLSIFWSFYLAK